MTSGQISRISGLSMLILELDPPQRVAMFAVVSAMAACMADAVSTRDTKSEDCVVLDQI